MILGCWVKLANHTYLFTSRERPCYNDRGGGGGLVWKQFSKINADFKDHVYW